jgi:predicted metalloprotease with PDZ domain
MLKKISALFLLLITATSVFAAEDKIRRTLIVRNGDVLLDETDPPGKRAFVGVSLAELTPELREFFGATKDFGILVSSVVENGPAAKGGVRVGDVITAINGKTITGYRDLREAIKDNHAGDTIRIDVIRGKSRQTLTATAEEREGPEFPRFHLKELEHMLPPPPNGEWHQRILPPAENEELRARIRDLEKRLQDLEKRLQK